jgi:murein DD-endopeptidase MepM/ murein hydrolase activator NlpD
VDQEPSSDRRGVRLGARLQGWGRAHRDAIRVFLQVAVILTGAAGLWLFDVGPWDMEPPPLAPSRVPTPTVGAAGPALDRLASGLRDGTPRSDLPDVVVVPERDSGKSADAPAPVVDPSPAFPPTLPAEIPPQGATPGDDRAQDAAPQDAPPSNTASQDTRAPDVRAPDAALPEGPHPEKAPQDVSGQDAAPPDAAAADAIPQGAPGPDEPVRAGGEVLPLDAPAEGSPAWTARPLSSILPGVFSSILPAPTPFSAGSAALETNEQWVWPVRGELSQGYSSGHRAIDVSTDQGAVVVAADAGTVVYAKWESTGYGYLVIVDHHNGFVSYYAHLYGFYIDVGIDVARGEQIGELGTTGRSTGPHLHFEIRQDGVPRDPLDLLP